MTQNLKKIISQKILSNKNKNHLKEENNQKNKKKKLQK